MAIRNRRISPTTLDTADLMTVEKFGMAEVETNKIRISAANVSGSPINSFTDEITATSYTKQNHAYATVETVGEMSVIDMHGATPLVSDIGYNLPVASRNALNALTTIVVFRTRTADWSLATANVQVLFAAVSSGPTASLWTLVVSAAGTISGFIRRAAADAPPPLDMPGDPTEEWLAVLMEADFTTGACAIERLVPIEDAYTRVAATLPGTLGATDSSCAQFRVGYRALLTDRMYGQIAYLEHVPRLLTADEKAARVIDAQARLALLAT